MIFALLSSGKLGHVRIGRRWLIPSDAIDLFIDANLVAEDDGKHGCVRMKNASHRGERYEGVVPNEILCWSLIVPLHLSKPLNPSYGVVYVAG